MSGLGGRFAALACLFVFLGGQSSADDIYRTASLLAENLPFLVTNSQPVDTAFIIDDSGSIPPDHFRKALEGTRTFIDSSQARNAKFAVIKYSDNPSILFNFVSKYEAKKKLANVQQDSGWTNTQAALKMAREDLFLNPASGHRQGAVRVAVLVTDGQSNIQRDQTVHQATLLKGFGTKVFVIAVGNYGTSGLQEMKDIASYPYKEHFFPVRDFQDFNKIARLVHAKVQSG